VSNPGEGLASRGGEFRHSDVQAGVRFLQILLASFLNQRRTPELHLEDLRPKVLRKAPEMKRSIDDAGSPQIFFNHLLVCLPK
jgi:hypothetical protein